ncbi:MAG: hypothetical protein EAZ85_04985 [Bacteroidetes bacterium]|nr:MAG: hypothetical protein EAZ85_04985 [Bacteroidota bacterium]TAG85381.1 MAG: hypothetical protein EAZ20_15285 [Bacteroidota bacterium]
MKKYYLTAIIFILFICNACDSKNDAKPDESGLFIKLLGGNQNELATNFIINDNGEVIGTGSTESFKVNQTDLTNVFLFKTDNLGNKIWQKGIEGMIGNDIIATNDGGYAIVGTTVLLEMHLLKISSQGVLEWQKTYTPPSSFQTIGVSLAPAKNNGFVLFGYSRLNTGVLSMYFANVSSNGNLQSSNTYGYVAGANGNIENEINSGKILANGDAVVAGSIIEDTEKKARISLVNSDLGIKWDYVYTSDITSSNTKSSDIQIANAGFIIAGTTTAAGKNTGFLLKTNSNGILSWKKNIEFDTNLKLTSVYPTEDGGYILTGDILMTDREVAHTNIWVGKVNSIGELSWHKNFGGRRDDVGKCVRVTKDGSYVILGTLGFETNKMLVLIRLDKNGNLIR